MCLFLSFQLENLMYYRESNHNKVVLRDFYLSRFENGSLTEPCGTPEYLGIDLSHDLFHVFFLFICACM